MNKCKKEQIRKYNEARAGLSKDEIQVLDREDEIKEKIANLAHKLHTEKFPEEYDFHYDSAVEYKERKRGVNPMRQEYIDRVTKKRNDQGVSALAENGMCYSHDTAILCEEEAKKTIYSDLELRRPPAKACVFCNKTIHEIGGQRMIAQRARGLTLTEDKNAKIGSEDSHRQSLEIFTDPSIYIRFWGMKGEWTESAILTAKQQYLNGQRPWFCQVCGYRKCSVCGSPSGKPMGSDILKSDGETSHIGAFPVDPGCIKSDCENFKDWQSNH